MKKISAFVPLSLLLACAVALSACQSGRAGKLGSYNPQAHQQAAELKVETVNLMAKSDEPYARHAAAVEALNTKIQTAYELAASTPDNELIVQQWAIMKDPERDLYGGFAKRWKASGRISDTFREEITVQVSQGYDYILCLEVAKRSPGKCTPGSGQ